MNARMPVRLAYRALTTERPLLWLPLYCLTPLPLLPIAGYRHCGINRIFVRLQIVDIMRR